MRYSIEKGEELYMVEKVYPMTLEGKAKLEQELEELKTVKREKSLNESKLPVALVIYLRTQNMRQLKMNKLS